MDVAAAAAAAAVEVVAVEAVAEAEIGKGAEAWFGMAPSVVVEAPEVPQWYGCTMTRICPPCPFGTGKFAYYPGENGPT